MLKYFYPVSIAQLQTCGPFRVGHHTKNITLFITNAGYVVYSAIGVTLRRYISLIIALAVNNLAVHFQLFQCFIVGKIPALAMCHRYF